MITKKNLAAVLRSIGYIRDASGMLYEKRYPYFDCAIQVDFNGSGTIKYPEDKGMKITHHTTCNFSDNENFVVLECVTRLMDKGYRPEHIELEKEWTLGHDAKGGRADICVYDTDGKTLFIVECKTAGIEYKKEYNNTVSDGGQLFSYWQQERSCRWLALYASEFNGTEIEYTSDSIDCSDDANILASAKKNSSVLLYDSAHTVEELYTAWDETYDKRFCGDVIFRDDSIAYRVGVKPLRKADLKDFGENDKIVNKFEEILRHNNVSDKENAFNRLTALFICKLVDEIQKGDNDILEFQYKIGTDTYETLQDRLQRLHKEGMEKFMREEIFYVSDSYAEDLIQQYTGHKREKMIADLKKTLRILKFYTNNDFAFKDVHNEELFYQNGKILIEVVHLFQKFRIVGSNDVQMLGDLFEQLLNKGFKQNEGQFFTPAPICRFIWDSLPLERIMKKPDGIEFPKIIDYACGAGHFLTQGFEAVNANAMSLDPSFNVNRSWAEHKIFGVEKDYRLARVSKISLFMHGAGDGNIVFGDGLENYPDKEITPGSFDILVANPPYSVKGFKPHLKLKDNAFTVIDKISNDGSEIETLFVERIAQLVKPDGAAAVILPSSILSKENESFVGARESLLQNFQIRAIAQFGSKTFGATGTNTVIIFLEKYNEPPKRLDLVHDSINAIFEGRDLKDWEDDDILNAYLAKVEVSPNDYLDFVSRKKTYTDWETHSYFGAFYQAFIAGTEYNAKIKQRTFQKLSEADKLTWLNEHYYDFASAVEKEKLLYFALVYQQTTLIITAPDDNKKQETFLGYKWSNRKGQEGIQIITPGGMLYSEADRKADDKLSGVVRNSFYGKEYSIAGMGEYFYYLRLQDMIDFGSLVFNKAIKTAKTRALKTTPGLVNYKLSDKIFDVSIGDRVLSDEVIENGNIPVFSANVFEEFGRIDKQNITDFSGPSILWGIDGDWMVNMIPAGQPFYPTDHCGVLRVNSDDIVPRYLAFALQAVGEFEKFSRSNRASAQRIKSLTVQIPKDKAEQQRIVDEVEAIENEIKSEEAAIEKNRVEVFDRFVELFGTLHNKEKPFEQRKLGTCCELNPTKPLLADDLEVSFIPMPSISEQGVIDSSVTKTYADVKLGYTYFAENDVIFAKITPCMENGKGGIARNLKNGIGFGSTEYHILRPIPGLSNAEWLYYLTAFTAFRKEAAENMTGASGHRRVPDTFIKDFTVGLPPMPLQERFADFVAKIDSNNKLRREKIAELHEKKNEVIKKYFR